MFRHFLSFCIIFLTILIVSTSHVSNQITAASESPLHSKQCSHGDFFQDNDIETYKKCMKDSDRDDDEIQKIQHSILINYFYFLLKYLY